MYRKPNWKEEQFNNDSENINMIELRSKLNSIAYSFFVELCIEILVITNNKGITLNSKRYLDIVMNMAEEFKRLDADILKKELENIIKWCCNVDNFSDKKALLYLDLNSLTLTDKAIDICISKR